MSSWESALIWREVIAPYDVLRSNSATARIECIRTPPSLNDDLALHHVHAAGELEVAGLLRGEFDRRHLVDGDRLRDVLRRNGQHIAAGRLLVAGDVEAHRLSCLDVE